jgi:lipopolysaccharide/colanic/teichoic acid biosynthesis glycosyltransferase
MIRFFDIFLSGIAILILLPFMIPVMIGLKLTGEHYIFYTQTRVGKHARDFKLLKFATMLKDSPNLPGGLYTGRHDPRILPMGALLRRTKINELPQLVNVFIGQMSLVGYRPTVREHYNAAYPDAENSKVYRLNPGLTGIGSIVFRNEEEILHRVEDKKDFHLRRIMPYKAELEGWYADHRNLWNYFRMIFITVYTVIRPSSGSWKRAFRGLPLPPEELAPFI